MSSSTLQLESRIVLPELGKVLVRELRRPEDVEAYLRFGAAISVDDLRMRFAAPTKWTPALARRMLTLAGTAFAAFGEDGEILGVGRLVGNEIALAVRSKLKRRGLGRVLLERIVHHASEHGMAEITGTALAENRPMLALAQAAGFRMTGAEGPMVSGRLCLPRKPPHIRDFTVDSRFRLVSNALQDAALGSLGRRDQTEFT